MLELLREDYPWTLHKCLQQRTHSLTQLSELVQRRIDELAQVSTRQQENKKSYSIEWETTV